MRLSSSLARGSIPDFVSAARTPNVVTAAIAQNISSRETQETKGRALHFRSFIKLIRLTGPTPRSTKYAPCPALRKQPEPLFLQRGDRAFVAGYGVSITAFQFPKYEGGKNRESAEDEKGIVNAVNHFRRAGMSAVGNENRGGERGRGDAEAHGQLLERAGDGARAAGLIFFDVCVNQGVHAGVLERGEKTVAEKLEKDQPERGIRADGRKKDNHQANDDGVGDQHCAVAETREDFGHGHLKAHGRERLRHHHEAGLDGRETKPNLVEQGKEEGNAADADAGDEPARHRGAKGAQAQKGEAQEREGLVRGVQAITGEQRE